MIDYAGEVRRARKLLGLSGRELAKRLKVSLRTVRYWEAGVVRPRRAVFGRLLVMSMGKGRR